MLLRFPCLPVHPSITTVCPEPPVNKQRLALGLHYVLALHISISGSGMGGWGRRDNFLASRKSHRKSLGVKVGSVPMRLSGEKNQMYLAISRAVGWGWPCPGPLLGLLSLTGRFYQRLTRQVLHWEQTWLQHLKMATPGSLRPHSWPSMWTDHQPS